MGWASEAPAVLKWPLFPSRAHSQFDLARRLRKVQAACRSPIPSVLRWPCWVPAPQGLVSHSVNGMSPPPASPTLRLPPRSRIWAPGTELQGALLRPTDHIWSQSPGPGPGHLSAPGIPAGGGRASSEHGAWIPPQGVATLMSGPPPGSGTALKPASQDPPLSPRWLPCLPSALPFISPGAGGLEAAAGPASCFLSSPPRPPARVGRGRGPGWSNAEATGHTQPWPVLRQGGAC